MLHSCSLHLWRVIQRWVGQVHFGQRQAQRQSQLSVSQALARSLKGMVHHRYHSYVATCQLHLLVVRQRCLGQQAAHPKLKAVLPALEAPTGPYRQQAKAVAELRLHGVLSQELESNSDFQLLDFSL